MSDHTNLNGAFSQHADSVTSDAPASHPAENQTTTSDIGFDDAIQLLGDLHDAGLDDIDSGLAEVVELLQQLAQITHDHVDAFTDDDPDIAGHIEFVIKTTQQIRKLALEDDAEELDAELVSALREDVNDRLETSSTIESGKPSECSDSDVVAPSADEVAALLAQLSDEAIEPASFNSDVDASAAEDDTTSEETDFQNDQPQAIQTPAKQTLGSSGISVPEVDETDIDDEIREAFLDDASRGLESMEQALLELESNPGASEPVKVILRELHTIKGASASIGMEHLANYIHEIEEYIREQQDAGNQIPHQELLTHVDVIRARVEGTEPPTGDQTCEPRLEPTPLQSQPDHGHENTETKLSTASTATPTPSRSSSTQSTGASSTTEDETVRVKASQLNRLMDMLSELVMLRNQRDTELSELKQIHDELTYSVTRMRMLSHEGESLLAMDKLADADLAADGVSFSRLNEVANDVMESAQRLHDCYQPVAHGNEAVSQFIRNFRLELTQLRRTPVAGLFRRLHRAISDAARTEQKQVRVELLGENTGIERSLQERIFEPLLHIVRNSVSHGIESPEVRSSKGKSVHGTVTLHAHSGPDLLVIEVRDDGGGLDYDAIRRRGIERGLISPDSSTSRAELAQLIFHPGFSTRQTADQLSGRGVGMDVVASTLERMRGWVEVDSEAGQGSTIRLSLPLPSMIQHVMLFRSGGQLFALPVQSIRQAGDEESRDKAVYLNDILQLQNSGSELDKQSCDILQLTTHKASVENDRSGDFSILVDRIIGPEEVVVRPLPTLLKPHPLCVGATLSGMGEVVLLLDSRNLVSSARHTRPTTDRAPLESAKRRAEGPRVLVVDDSKSARLRVVRALQQYQLTIDQFEDGQAAWDAMSSESYDVVFSDIDMPRMTGLDLLASIKSHDELKNTPVVMISSRSSETTGKQARKLGALAYIQKPLQQRRLDAVVSHFAWAKS